ncbi:unnamed protein product, partial [Thlaspi arvense]
VEWTCVLWKSPTNGWRTQLYFNPTSTRGQSSVKEAFLDAGNGPYRGFTLDHEVGAKLVGSIIDSGKDMGRKGNLNNLKVAVHATVERVVFHNSESLAWSLLRYPVFCLICYPLSAKDYLLLESFTLTPLAGPMESCYIPEVNAGAIGSTQLLLLSGVGPNSDLSSLNIPAIYHQPFVGQLLYDLTRNDINIIPPFPMAVGGLGVVGITKKWLLRGSYIRSASVFPFYSPPGVIVFPHPSPPVSFPVLTLFEKLSKRSQPVHFTWNHYGYPQSPPRSDPKDLAQCVQGMRNVEKAMNSQAMEKYKFQDQEGNRYFKFVGRAFPENKTDDEEMETFCRKTMATIWNYHGGCVVGKVVDKDLKVVGVNALRVC